MVAVRSRKRTFTKQRVVWVAYVRPDGAKYPQPEFKVVAPASWKKERVLRALWDKGVDVSILRSLHMELAMGIEDARRLYDWLSEGEAFCKAWEEMPRKVLYLPSGRTKTFPAKERADLKKIKNFLPAYPQAEISVHHHEDEEVKGKHVLRVYAHGIHRHVFRWNFHTFSSTVRDFVPVGSTCDFIDEGYEIVFGPVLDTEAVQVVCKLVKNIASRLIRKGFLSYRLDGETRKPLPQYYLKFITEDEFLILQSFIKG
jgi:hypothetical protein